MQGYFLLSILIALVAADDDRRENKQIFSPLYDRIIDQTSSTFIPYPVFLQFPTIRIDQSIDTNHARWEQWGEPFASRARIDDFKLTCLSYYNSTFGFDSSNIAQNLNGSYSLPDVRISPISRQPGPTDRVMYDSTIKLGGNWSAREVAWNAEILTNGVFGGQKAGQQRIAGGSLTCAQYFFYKVDADLSKRKNFRTYQGRSFYVSYIFRNEYGAQSLHTQVELTDQDGVPGKLWEQQAIEKDPAGLGWYINAHSHFALGPAAVKQEDDKRRSFGLH